MNARCAEILNLLLVTEEKYMLSQFIDYLHESKCCITCMSFLVVETTVVVFIFLHLRCFPACTINAACWH